MPSCLPVEEGDRVHLVADPDYERRKLEVTELSEEVTLESDRYSVTLSREEFMEAVENSEKGKLEGFPKIWTEVEE